MHGKLVVLLLAALQVSFSSQCELPDNNSLPDSYEHQRSRSHYDDSYDGDQSPNYSDDNEPVHEDQREDNPSRSRDDSAEDCSGADPRHHSSPRQECEIFVNPIRPPYEGPNKPSIGEYSERSGTESSAEPPTQDIPEEEFQSHQAYSESTGSGGINGEIEGSVANSAINEQTGAAPLSEGSIPDQTLINKVGPIGLTLLSPFLPSNVLLPINQPIIGPSPLIPLIAPGLPAPVLMPSPNFCIRHRLVRVPVRVVEDCITNVPVLRETLRHQVETVTKHVPVLEKTVTQQHEKIVRHVPIAGKTVRNVVETRVRHIPVIKSRTRTVVEPYTVHIPITMRFTRPVEESVTKTVPVQEVRVRPVVTRTTRLIPVVERRLRPIVEQMIDNVPVRKKYLRTIVEQRVRPVVGPCRPCIIPFQLGLPLSIIPAEDIPRILLSPYSDITGAPNGEINGRIGGDDSRNLARPNVLISSLTNEQMAPYRGEQLALPCGQPIPINTNGPFHPDVSAPEENAPNALHTIQNLHDTDCSPRPSC